MLLTDHHERLDRNEKKQQLILNFLSVDKFSDIKTLARVIHVKDKSTTRRLLKKMEANNLIKSHSFNTYASSGFKLWGITNQGQAYATFGSDDLYFGWEPSKTRLSTLEHHFIIQDIRLTLEENGAKNWIHGDSQQFYRKYETVKKIKHRPDGIITLTNGIIVAIEIELNIKSPKRYKEIMISHLLAITNKHWGYVQYIVTDQRKKKWLQKIITDVKLLIVNGKPVEIEQKHHNVFKIQTIEEYKKLNQ